MKTRIVPSSELSTKTLRAKDYVLKPFKITYVEETETDVVVYLDVQTTEEAREMLDEMDDSDFIATMRKGKRAGFRVTDRAMTDVEVTDGEV
jgi:hypothetical protein